MVYDNKVATFSIGTVAQLLGVSSQTLRLWETKGLVTPTRNGNGQRSYNTEEVERLKWIRRLRVVDNLNFAAIREKLETTYVPDAPFQGGQENTTNEFVANKLRRLRYKSRKTLKEVSNETGLSVSFVSTVERAGSGASVASLRLLAKVYGVTLREIFGADLQEYSPLVRREDRPIMKLDDGVQYEELACGKTSMDPSWLRVPPKSGSGGFYSHPGEEFFCVIEGEFYVELKGSGTFRLLPGDTLYFSSPTPHRWWAEEEAAQVLAVNTPPTF